jgi:hypothetical protein
MSNEYKSRDLEKRLLAQMIEPGTPRHEKAVQMTARTSERPNTRLTRNSKRRYPDDAI